MSILTRFGLGNWSLFTKEVSGEPLYAYYNPVALDTVVRAEEDLLSLIEDEGPFDGCLGFCGGAMIAGQIILQDFLKYPDKQPSERPFRFAVFINGATPIRVFNLEDEELRPDVGPPHAIVAEAESILLRPSATRKKDEMSDEERIGYETLRELIGRFETRYLKNGQSFISDGEYGMYRYNLDDNGGKPIITIPTLHIRDPSEDLVGEVDHGMNLWQLCDPAFAKEFHHTYGHDFPRGRREMKKISQLIRETAQDSMLF